MKLTQIKNTSAYPIRVFTPDTVPPACLYYDLDINSPETLLLQFTEPVREDSLILADIMLYNSVFKVPVSFTATNRRVSIYNQTALQVIISQQDIYALKYIYKRNGLLDLLFFQDNAVYDFSGNFIQGNGVGTLQPDVKISLRRFTADTSTPVLLSAVLDLSVGQLTLQYSEPIDITVLVANHIIFLPYANYSYLNGTNFSTSISYASSVHTTANETLTEQMADTALRIKNTIIHTKSSGHQIQLTDYSVIETNDQYAVVIDMALYARDINIIKEQTYVATSKNDTFLAIYGVSDLFGNIVSDPLIVPITKFIPDNNLLIVTAFDYLPHASVLNTGSPTTDTTLINIYFQNTVELDSFNCTDFLFTSSPYVSSKTSVVKLPLLHQSQCQVLSTDNTHVVSFSVLSSYFTSLQPVSTDTANQNLYISVPTVTASSTRSINNKYLAPIVLTRAIQTGPRILKFTLDMNTRELVLVFSKSVQLFTGAYNNTQLGFFSTSTKFDFFCFNATSSSQFLTPYVDKTNASSTSASVAHMYGHSFNDSIAKLYLSVDEINSIKLLDITQSTLALVAKNHLVKDVDNVWVTPLPVPPAVSQASSSIHARLLLTPVKFAPDNVRPALVSWDLDVGNGLIIMHFPEPIRTSSVQVRQITFMASNYSLTEMDAINSQFLQSLNSTDTTLDLSYTLTGIDNDNNNNNTSYSCCVIIIFKMTNFVFSTLRLLTNLLLLL